jgi:uncharacterized cupin superfamily protein
MSQLILFSQHAAPVQQDRPAPGRKISGDPLRSTWNLFDSPAGDMAAGIWQSEPGSWKISFGPGEDEFFHVTEGHCRVIDEDGNATDVIAGDALLIPAGFQGVFEVLETVKKYYVIVDRSKRAQAEESA